MDERSFGKMAGPLVRRLQNLVVRGTVVLANAAGKMQALQVRLLQGDVPGTLEHFEPYGFTSRPRAGAEVVALFFDGDRSHGFVVVCADRRYRVAGLAEGEVAIHDDKGQAVVLKADGIHVHAEHHFIHAPATIDGPLTVAGAISGAGGISVTGDAQISGEATIGGDALIGGKSFLGHTNGGAGLD